MFEGAWLTVRPVITPTLRTPHGCLAWWPSRHRALLWRHADKQAAPPLLRLSRCPRLWGCHAAGCACTVVFHQLGCLAALQTYAGDHASRYVRNSGSQDHATGGQAQAHLTCPRREHAAPVRAASLLAAQQALRTRRCQVEQPRALASLFCERPLLLQPQPQRPRLSLCTVGCVVQEMMVSGRAPTSMADRSSEKLATCLAMCIGALNLCNPWVGSRYR